METTELLSIFGARLSQDEQKLILVLVSGEGDNKKFYNACIKLDKSQKTKARIEDDRQHALIKVAMLGYHNDDTPF